MNVTVDGIKYIVTAEPTADIQGIDQLYVAGQGYRADDPDQEIVEIQWNVDNPEAEDGADLVDNWDTADSTLALD